MDEQEIQETFVKWLTVRQGYVEELSDPNGGAGAICDSIGMLNGKPALIEFKCSITPSIVMYTPTKSSSIERKIRNSLEELHKGHFLTHWRKETIPFIWLVAEKISNQASQEIINLLEKRCLEWGFDYEFGTWSGKSYSCYGNGPIETIPITKLKHVSFPSMPWPKENRSAKRNIDEFRIVADDHGVSNFFDYFIDRVSQYELSVICYRDSMNIRAPIAKTKKMQNVIGIWPVDSNENGLCVSVDHARLSECFPNTNAKLKSIPGTKAPKRGFLGPRIYLNSINEARQFWEWATGIKHA